MPTWTNIWKGLDLEHALTPVNLQTLRKEIQPSTINALAGGDGTRDPGVSPRTYRSEHVLIADGRARSGCKAPQYHRCRAETPWEPSRCRAPTGSMRRDPGYTSELAAVVALGVLEGRWKSTKTRGGGEAAPAPLRRRGPLIC